MSEGPSPTFPRGRSLVGDNVILVPMRADHADAMIAAAADGELWKSAFTSIPDAQSVHRYIENALTDRQKLGARPFVTTLAATGQIVGTTRFSRIDAANRKCEVGYSWIARSWQGSFVNPEARYLLLRHAFEHQGLLRVQIQADALNLQSRAALRKLGATEEGILRSDRIMPDGRVRDSAIYSIIASEWPQVKATLEARLRGLGVTPRLELRDAQDT